jgi:hypothetical protein
MISAAMVLSSAGIARAAPQVDNPYRQIAVRNVFGLRPATPSQKPATPSAPLPTIILTGITTILGDKRVLLEITPPSKPAQPQKSVSCMLSEGQQEDGVQVMAIEPKAETVKVSNCGTVMTLTFDKNGRKSTPAAPAPPTSVPVRRFPLRTAAR